MREGRLVTRKTWSIRRRPRRRGGGRLGWRKGFEEKGSKACGRATRLLNSLAAGACRLLPRFSIIIVISHFGTTSSTRLAHTRWTATSCALQSVHISGLVKSTFSRSRIARPMLPSGCLLFHYKERVTSCAIADTALQRSLNMTPKMSSVLRRTRVSLFVSRHVINS